MSQQAEDRSYLMEIAQWMEDTAPEQWIKDPLNTRARMACAAFVRQIARRIHPMPEEDEIVFAQGILVSPLTLCLLGPRIGGDK